MWLGGGNLIVLMSLKRQKLSLKHLLTPIFMTKLQGQDWLMLFILALATMIIDAVIS